jgi:APA family basic amino acid/polyamine antiporter
MMRSLWHRKSISLAAVPPKGLRRELGFFDLTLVGIGSTIGAGIFVITGTAAAQYAGPAIAISFLLAGFVCLCTALCYAELASMIPVAGSAYTYAYATLGELIAWIVGWCLVSYFVALCGDWGLLIPSTITSAPLDFNALGSPVVTGAWFNIPAAAIVLAMTAPLLIGTKQSASTNSALVLFKVGVILLVILVAAANLHSAYWHPFIPPHDPATGAFGWPGIMRGAGVIFFAYVGFDTISTSAQEARNPQRDLGWAILAALGACTALYVAMALVVTGLAPYRLLNVADPIVVALDHGGPRLYWIKPVVSVAAVVGLASTILVTLYGQSRIFYSMSQDGLLPKWFAKLHPTRVVPTQGTVVAGIACALFAGLFPLQILGELVSIGTLLAFTIVCMGVAILRRRMPDAERAFRVPLVPFVPVIGILGCLYLMLSLPSGTWIRLGVWLTIGLGVYWQFGAENAQRVRAAAHRRTDMALTE